MSDWDTVTVLRKRQPKASTMKTEGAVNQVQKFLDFDIAVARSIIHFFSIAHGNISAFRQDDRASRSTHNKNVSNQRMEYTVVLEIDKGKHAFRHIRRNRLNHQCICFRRTVAAGTNKQHVVTANTAKLDRETEELKHVKIPHEVGKLIQKGRNDKGLSQKDLATVN